MNKLKFETYLREKLSILKQSEIDEIINEYLQHIDMRKADGVSEEAAIKDFGDLDDLVDEILDAYKIDTSKDQFENFSNNIKKWLNTGLDFINKITNSIFKRSGTEMVTLVVEFVLVLVLLWVVSLVIDIVSTNVMRIFYYSPYFIGRIIRFLVRGLSLLFNLTISLSILYWFATERVIKFETSDTYIKTSLKAKNKKELAQKQKDLFEPSDDINIVKETASDYQTDEIILSKTIRPEAALEDLKVQASKESFSQKLFKGNLFVIKMIVLLILIPMIVVGVFLGIAFVIVVYNTIIGYGSIGISLILSGVFLMYFYLLTVGINFVSGGKTK
ncbi:MAG: DUF1700 domain-containing protein [Erysipelothrix sp.]|nr:DUF1700 domain-containing protein [Erysipelothrix sp.]